MKQQILSTAILISVTCASSAFASISDFNNWTLLADPADPNFSGSVDSASQITLTATDASGSASGSVPAGTDLAYQSVSGSTASDSTSGFAFSRDSSFSVAVNYDANFTDSPTGGLVLGFGIGEDSAGTNSAGIILLTEDGLPPVIPFVGPAIGAARVNDSSTLEFPLSSLLNNSPSSLEGSFHVGYDANSGDITVGFGNTDGDSPIGTTTFAAADVFNQWGDGDLIVSFFIRSDTVRLPGSTFATPWSDGQADVIFSNFRVTNGAAFVVPEPTSCALLGLGSLLLARRRSL